MQLQDTTAPSRIKFNRFAFFAGAAAFCLALVLSFTQVQNVSAVGATFTFGAAGDHGDSAEARPTESFKAIGAANLNFFQTLGDLSYGSNAEVPAWCQFVKDKLNVGAGLPTGNTYGENYPFMLLTGNHETNQQANGSDIDTFVQCMPNQLASQSTMSPVVGTGTDNYAKEYFYDYPAVSPYARFIVTSPDIQLNSNGTYQYTVGNPHYQWLSDAIDSARTLGYKWVIVSNHKNYISTGQKTNEIGSDYFNLLVDKKVDLILQGHDHTYQRSKQLALSGTCAAVTAGTPDTDCVVDDGSDDTYTKGSGSILVIAGNFGHSFYTADTGDSEYPYFSKIMPNSNNTAGFVKFTVSETSIDSTFVEGIGDSGTFTDSFSISDSTPPPSGGDTTPPTVSLTAPADSATLSGTANVTATAADTVGVTKVEFYAGATKLGEDTTAPYAYSWDTTAATNGAYSLTAKAYDAATNVTQSAAVAVTVTNDAPATFTVANKDGVTESSVKLSGTCTQNPAGTAAATPTQFAGKTVVTSIGFTVSCSASGGSAVVTIDLGKKYETLSALKVHKDQSDNTIKDITSEATIEDRTVGNKTTTFVTYTVVDGSTGDGDGTANSAIEDPVYVLDETTTTPNTPAELAKTGIKLLGLVSIVALLVAVALEVTNRDKRFYSIFKR